MRSNRFRPALAGIAAAMALSTAGTARAQTLFGTLSNFDVFNDTGQECQGFEIEVDGITREDVSYTFGGAYIRYGDPVIVDIPGGILVRYQSAYDPVRQAFMVRTPVPAAITSTAGHQCWTGGAPGYATSGCEHFGVGLLKTPANTQYRWLVGDPAAPGALMPLGAAVKIAAPVWTVSPAPGGAAPVVQAAIEPPRAPAAQFGEAVWVKVYETESPEGVGLEHLLTDDPAVPQRIDQVETEWELLQSNPNQPGNGERQHGKPLGKGSKSVIRRFEFFKYTGAYDPQTHEALCAGGGNGSGARKGGDSGSCAAPAAAELGDYIGAQMAAAQFDPPAGGLSVSSVSNSANGQAAITGGSLVSIYGRGFTSTAALRPASDSFDDLSWGGVRVRINGKDAAVTYVSPTQINVQAPPDNALGAVEVEVGNSSGFARRLAIMQPYAPGFFQAPANYIAAVHSDGAYVAPAGFFGAAAPSRPAAPGETVLLFGTGFGPASAPVPPGPAPGDPVPLADLSALSVRIGGVAAAVQFAGLVGPGEYQFNVTVPDVASGDQTILANIAGLTTQRGLLLSIGK